MSVGGRKASGRKSKIRGRLEITNSNSVGEGAHVVGGKNREQCGNGKLVEGG